MNKGHKNKSFKKATGRVATKAELDNFARKISSKTQAFSKHVGYK